MVEAYRKGKEGDCEKSLIQNTISRNGHSSSKRLIGVGSLFNSEAPSMSSDMTRLLGELIRLVELSLCI